MRLISAILPFFCTLVVANSLIRSYDEIAEGNKPSAASWMGNASQCTD